jgi:hypothetical protein
MWILIGLNFPSPQVNNLHAWVFRGIKRKQRVFNFAVGSELGDRIFVAISSLVKHRPAVNAFIFLGNIHADLKILRVLFLWYKVDYLAYNTAFGFIFEVQVFKALFIDIVYFRRINVF